MKLKFSVLVAVGLAFSASGCTTKTTEPSLSPTVPLEAIFSDCRDWTNGVAGPTTIFGGPIPEGWGRTPASFLLMDFLECNRISWGTFERGPVHILMEFTEDSFAPASCLQGNFDRYHILRSFWIDDEEVASWVKTIYGIPALVGEFTVTNPGGPVETWTWSQPGREQSEITFQDTPPTQDTPLTYIHRAFWFNETAVSYMDIREDYLNDDYASPAAYGTLRPPMQYVSMTGQTAYAGGVDHSASGDDVLSIYRFSDLDCKNPV